MNNCILLRYGEIGLKSNRTRPIFEKLYVSSLEDALKRNKVDEYEIKNYGGRFVVTCKKPEEVCQVLKKVSGVQSLSPARRISFSDKKDILKESKSFEKFVKGKTFGVKVKRTGSHKFDSMSLAKEVGEQVYHSSKGVDLTNPDVWIFVEIRNKEAFFYSESIKGIGGLPIGTSERVLCLFSGGIDSPVAALEMMKRGCKVDFLFVNIMGEKLFNDVAKVYNYLISNYSYGYKPTFYFVDGKKAVEKIKKNVPDSMKQLAYKIVLYKVGEVVAKNNRHLCLVSGESLAQKSSQTLRSLLFIEKQADISMMRPLLTFDKIDIASIAREIGTLSISEKIKEYCDLSIGAVTTSPRTSDIKKIKVSEKDIEEITKKVESIKGFVEVNEDVKFSKTKNVVAIDMRAELIREKESIKKVESMSFSEAYENLSDFDKGKSYLLICEFGVRTEEVAYELRKRGINAAGISYRNYIKYFSKV